MASYEEDVKELAHRLGPYGQMALNEVPSHMREAVVNYVLSGHPVGDFLFAVLSNDLMRSFMRADAMNSISMKSWAGLLFNLPQSPIPSYGSEEKVRAWQKMGGLRGLDAELARRRLEEEKQSFAADVQSSQGS